VLFTLRLQAADRFLPKRLRVSSKRDALRAMRSSGRLQRGQRRYAPICFAGSVETAAKIAESFLLGQVKEIQREAGRLLAACD
jgi:hypothetical protein